MKNSTPEATVKHSAKLINNDSGKKIPFSVVEAYKTLRIHLVSVLKEQNKKVVAVTSPNASEGKSTTAINLALMLSQLSKKVLLIDADARRSTVHTKLKIENGLGCMDIMSGGCALEEALNSYNQYLDVLTAGNTASGSSELFCSAAFDRLLTDAAEAYDYVVVDTPPVNLVSDSLVIAQKCDGTLLVARTSVTSYADYKNAYSSIEKLKINLLGAVLNGVGSKSDRYYYSDKYKYGYSKY